MQLEIPKRIIQTGKSSHLPLKERAAVCNLKLLNPDFEYLFFDNEQVETFIDDEFPQYRTTFDTFSYPIQKYDFFRYLAVYRYGGFYFDLDVFLASGLSDLLATGCIFPFEGLTYSKYLREKCLMDWQIGNYAFGAAAGHPFLLAIIQNCVKAQQAPEWVEPMMRGVPRFSRAEFWVLNTTGPGLISRTLAESPALAGEVTVLFPDDVSDPDKWNRFGEHGVHLMNGSWRAQGGFLRRRAVHCWEAWRMRTVLAQSRLLGKTRSPILSRDSR